MRADRPDKVVPQTEATNGAIATFFVENKALCIGAALSLLTMTTIFTNAIMYQPGKHPAPLFATRNIEAVTPVAEKTQVAKLEVVTKKPVKNAKDEVSEEVLREVQSALSVRGYYNGKIDGLFGSRTEKAITSFQADHSIKKDGIASVRLLTQILMSASASPKAVPIPKSADIAKIIDKESKTDVAKAEVATTQSVRKVDITALKPAEAPKAATKDKKEEFVDGLIAKIQSGLRGYGYDDLVVDGKLGQQTSTAIQRFQLDYGMKITGEPSEALFDKLREIGAYRQG